MRWKFEKIVIVMPKILAAVKKEDEVTGISHIPEIKTTGEIKEIGGLIMKDAAWLRKKDDYYCINVAELDAMLEGNNPALKWGLREVELRTDSAIVLSWVNSTIEEWKNTYERC